MKGNILMLLAACPVALGVGWWLYNSTPESTDQSAITPAISQPEELRPILRENAVSPQPVVAEPTPVILPPEEPLEPLPEVPSSLAESDNRVKAALAILSPDLLRWATPKEQLRKWVSLVNNVADGRVPIKNRPIKLKVEPFTAEERSGKLYLSAANYSRAAGLIDALVAVEPDLMMRYYQAWKPLLDEAYNELGLGDDFDDRLLAAIERVLSVPVLEQADIQLKRPVVFYTFADKELEQAPELDRFLWRLGPDNTHKLQGYLEDFALRFQRVNPGESTTIDTPLTTATP